MLNWDDMRIFLAVARTESLSAAAPTLQMDPATLSRRIARLEAELNAPLFVKSPQGYLLTDFGNRVREEATQAEQAISRVRDASADTGGKLSGQIRIGAPDGCAAFLLPQVCARIQEQNPELEIQILAQPRVVNLSQREADMAITVSPPASGRFLVKKITDYRLYLAQRSDQTPPQNLGDVSQMRVVGYIQDMIFDKELDYLDTLSRPKVLLSSNSVAVQMNLLQRSGGVGIVHDFALPAFPDLRRVLADEFALTRSYYLVRHRSNRRSERFRHIAELLSDGIKREVQRLQTS